MNPRVRIALGVAALLVGAAVVFALTRGDGDPSDALRASGTVEATEADLAFQIPGRIREITAREGQPVSGGQELAFLERTETDAVVAGARARMDAAEARLLEMRRGALPEDVTRARRAVDAAARSAEEAAREAERAERLFEGGAVSRQARDQARTSAQVAAAARDQAEQSLTSVRRGPREEALAAQRALVEQARADVERTEAVADQGVIAAPFPGVVTVRHREPGEVVGAGLPVLTVLDAGDRWVRIYVQEDRIGAVRIGQGAEVRSDTYPDRVYRGQVTFIGSQAEFTPRNVQTTEERTRLVYPVKVRILDDPEFVLKPGVPADVVLTGARAGDAGSP